MQQLRKIGERIDTVTVDLVDHDVVELNAKACQLRDQQDALKLELAGVKQQYKARAQKLADAEQVARRDAARRKKDVEILIHEFITPTNEVVMIRMDTKEPIGRRTATAEELQEDMFGGDDEDETSGKPS